MDAVEPLQTECTVSGVLYFVLYISRVLGIAPLNFEKLNNGWRLRVSRISSLYCHVLTISLMMLSMSVLISDLTINKETSLRMKTNANLFFWLSDLIVVDVVILAATCTGINRMTCMIDCMSQLKQINKELSRYHPQISKSETKIRILVSFLILLGLFTNATDYVILMVEVNRTNGNVTEELAANLMVKVLTSIFYVAHNILCFVVKVLVVQFCLTATMVLKPFYSLNVCLRLMYKEKLSQFKPNIIYKNAQSTVFPQKIYRPSIRLVNLRPINIVADVPNITATSETLHRLTLLYCSLCDIVRELNSCNGLILVLLFLSIVSQLIFTFYHIIIGLFADMSYSKQSFNTPLQSAWAVYQIIKLVMLVEPCHRTHEQMEQCKILINQLRRYTPPDDVVFTSKLKMFYRHIMLNQVSYSPMHLYMIDRALVAAIVGSITTYLIVIIEL